MTDKDIIQKHLDRYYTPSIKPNYDDAVVNPMGVVFISDNKFISNSSLIVEIKSMFGDYVDTNEIVNDWLKDKYDLTFKGIYKSLEEVQVVFGVRSWEVKRNNTNFKLDWLLEKHSNDYDKNTILAIYEEWKYNEIMRISEEILSS